MSKFPQFDRFVAFLMAGDMNEVQYAFPNLTLRELKEFIANALAKDPQVSNISQEKTTVSQVLKGEWRRPDVKCEYRGMPLVFEIQLSYTFLSDVIARDEFYRRERIFIIWVFARFDPRRAAVTDEAFFNRRNLFVMDARGRSDTDELGQLTFSGYRQTPTLFGEHIRDVWQAAPVGLHQVTFPPGHGRPYFFDYEDERRRIESAKRVVAPSAGGGMGEGHPGLPGGCHGLLRQRPRRCGGGRAAGDRRSHVLQPCVASRFRNAS